MGAKYSENPPKKQSREVLDKATISEVIDGFFFFRDAPALSTQATPASTGQSEHRTKVCAT